ncbi:CbtA family protein [Pantoea anthophila]|uniref:CbtA family protein n=1 Tax=Pantoea anthophila TaxID=470931 RepID=UPI002783EC45|nr:CbtA family protein [Pantoea anthophila]MDQ1214313.1 putative cobalt transporter CbtA [Pantoea anthophila]
MIGKLLLKGMMAGILAGLVAFAFAHHFGEPQVDRAIGLEESLSAHTHQHGASADSGEEQEVFSRQTQSGIGLMAGMALFGAALGGGLALVWAFSYQRIGPSNPRVLALCLALAGFLAMSLMPGLKYPPNPPAVGNPDTIGYRTGLYFVMMLLSIGIVISATWLSRQLTPRLGSGNALMWAVLFGIALMLVVCALMPTVNEVPDHFPADLLWNFRMSSFGTHLVLWGVIGVAFGALAERAPATHRQQPVLRRG